MSLIGKSIYHIHGVNQLQFGTVIDEKQINTWLWVQINWVNGAPSNIYNSPSVSKSADWVRVDNVRVFQPSKMIKSLQKL
tara:strand:+ start:1302 stop:1541 length:240 start_codon:yes stop_codon:yes gene_type:complete